MTDLIITPTVTKIAEAAAKQMAMKALNLGWRKIKWLPVTHLQRSDHVRIACSAFLRVRDEQQRYLLIKNFHRPEFFGPIGGCYKYLDGIGSQTLDRFFFGPDTSIAEEEAMRDLRGYIKRSETAKFFEWFHAGSGRESYRECISRELKEEFFGECQIKIPTKLKFDALSFMPIRSFLEKSHIPGSKTLQLRSFEIYDLDLASSASQILDSAIKKANSTNMLWATKEEIEQGRHHSSKNVLGHAAVLFVNDKIVRPDFPTHAKR